MSFCINFNAISTVLFSEFTVGLIAFVLGYFAYAEQIKSKYDSFFQIINSFKNELKAHKNWIGNEYEDKHKDKQFYNPYKIVYGISFSTPSKILELSLSEVNKVDKKFYDKIAIFNERVDEFNSINNYQRNIIVSDITLANELRNELNNIKLNCSDYSFDDFKKDIENIPNSKIQNLSEEIYRINNVLHGGLIGNSKREDGLYSLQCYLITSIEKILQKKEKIYPFWIKKKIKYLFISGITLWFVLYLIHSNVFVFYLN